MWMVNLSPGWIWGEKKGRKWGREAWMGRWAASNDVSPRELVRYIEAPFSTGRAPQPPLLVLGVVYVDGRTIDEA